MKGFYTLQTLRKHRIMAKSVKGNTKIQKYRKEHFFLSFLYVAGISLVLPFTLWYVNNPDAFQYISIAEKIAAGHFSLALNGYWSPLISWLIVVPVFFGIDGIIAFKALQILIGLFALTAWFRLCLVAGITGW